jgi:hypothetical protein
VARYRQALDLKAVLAVKQVNTTIPIKAHKKYIKRERNKKRPEEVDFWDFDCRYGANEASCGVIHVSEIIVA